MILSLHLTVNYPEFEEDYDYDCQDFDDLTDYMQATLILAMAQGATSCNAAITWRPK